MTKGGKTSICQVFKRRYVHSKNILFYKNFVYLLSRQKKTLTRLAMKSRDNLVKSSLKERNQTTRVFPKRLSLWGPKRWGWGEGGMRSCRWGRPLEASFRICSDRSSEGTRKSGDRRVSSPVRPDERTSIQWSVLDRGTWSRLSYSLWLRSVRNHRCVDSVSKVDRNNYCLEVNRERKIKSKPRILPSP